MGAPVFSTLLLFCLTAWIGNIFASQCEQKAWLKTEPSCDRPEWEAVYEVYEDWGGKQHSKWCCPDKDKRATRKAYGRGCQTTQCVTTGEDPCSTINKRRVEGIWYDTFNENMRDECTDENGKKGVVAVCCPPTSMANALLSVYGAEINEFPHQAKMFSPSHCGGTVYNKDYILMASHCIVDDGVKNDPSRIKILLGTNIGGMRTGEGVFEVEEVIPHENYSRLVGQPEFPKGRGGMIYNDVALLKLKRSIDFRANPNIRALKIAPANFKASDYADQVIIVGWGTTNELIISEHLQKANLVIRTHEQCYNATYADSVTGEIVQKGGHYHKYEALSDQFLCIGGHIGDSRSPTAGQGDSGGPAICRDEEGYAVHCGVTSFGTDDKKCAANNDEESCAPSMYAAVSHFHDWIVLHAGEQDKSSFYKVPLYGEKVPTGKYQHQVHIESIDGTVCGGTLVSQDIVITAAHCLMDDNGNGRPNVDIYAGIQDLSKKRTAKPYHASGQVGITADFRRVPEVDQLSSEKYQTLRNGYYVDDIAVIKLDRKVPINPRNLAKLPKHQPKRGPAVETAFPLDTHRSGSLMMRDFKILDNADCQRRLDRLSFLNVTASFDTVKVFCGVEKYSGGSICDREDGGGLFCKNDKGEEELCGIQTFRMCRTSIPNAFLKVSTYMPFIKQAMAINNK